MGRKLKKGGHTQWLTRKKQHLQWGQPATTPRRTRQINSKK